MNTLQCSYFMKTESELVKRHYVIGLNMTDLISSCVPSILRFVQKANDSQQVFYCNGYVAIPF